MDPYTLAYVAGHSDFATTKRHVHPRMETIRAAMEKVQGGHTTGSLPSEAGIENQPNELIYFDFMVRPE